jgi:ATP-binding cassette, subfamily F, member 3
LLKAIARGEIDGFPDHLRVLHVRQEVPTHLSDSMTVLTAVLNSDVELNMLIQREKEIVAKLEQEGEALPLNLSVEERRKKLNESAAKGIMETDLKELDSIYARLQVLSADATEARASMILAGLQFSLTMQQSPLSSLSGGWKMRVALATALFIEPDILML